MMRLATGGLRPLPDFLILGAMKSGTTSLFRYLGQHPKVRVSAAKAVHFFDLDHSRGPRWYRSHFPLLRSGAITGEATPYYLCHPHAPQRIGELLPRARLVVLLRNPTDRAISHYSHEARKGRESLPILEALEAEEGRVGPEWARMLRDESYNSPVHRRFSYKQRGLYVEQLERYWRHFDEGALLPLKAERLYSDPRGALTDVCRFLGVEPDLRRIDLTPHNVDPAERVAASRARDYLDEFFHPHNERLRRRIGDEFAW